MGNYILIEIGGNEEKVLGIRYSVIRCMANNFHDWKETDYRLPITDYRLLITDY